MGTLCRVVVDTVRMWIIELKILEGCHAMLVDTVICRSTVVVLHGDLRTCVRSWSLNVCDSCSVWSARLKIRCQLRP